MQKGGEVKIRCSAFIITTQKKQSEMEKKICGFRDIAESLLVKQRDEHKSIPVSL